YGEQATVELAGAGVDGRVLVGRSLAAQQQLLAGVVGSVRRLGLEAEHVSWSAQRGYAETFTAELVATTGVVEEPRPVEDAREVDAACRRHITAAGWGDEFTHGTGHGVGLLIHEAPWVNATSTDRIEAGVVVTVEPGVYRGALGGARVEDTVLVTSDGCRPLTKTPKDLACLR